MGTLIKKKRAEARLGTRFGDALGVAVPWFVVLVLSGITITEFRSTTASFVLVAIATVSTLWFFQRSGLYQTRPTLPRTDEIARLLRSVLAGTAVTVVAVSFLDWTIGAQEVVLASLLTAGLGMLGRGLIRSIADQLPGKHVPERVIIVGAGREAGELATVIADHPESRFELVGLVGHLPVAETNGNQHLWLGPVSRLVEIMHVNQTRSALVTPTGFRSEQFKNITSDLFAAGFDVHLSTGVSRLWDGRFEVRSLAHEPLVVMGTSEPKPWQRRIKRGVDIVGASIGLIIAAPVLVLTAMAIKVEDGGPVLFRQARAGRRAKTFDMVKFRSMVPNAEELKAELFDENERTGPLFKLSDDPRITRVGHLIRETSVDELPQLWNVLRGEMSLVGPRPALLEEEAAFDEELRGRFDVRPGITGLWQVEARRNASFDAYRRLDLHYVENWTLGLDIRIILATVEQIVVSLAMLPIKRFLPGAGIDRISTPTPTPGASGTVIDLRVRTTARLVAEHAAVMREDSTHGAG